MRIITTQHISDVFGGYPTDRDQYGIEYARLVKVQKELQDGTFFKKRGLSFDSFVPDALV